MWVLRYGVKIRSESGDEVEFLSDYRADGQITGGEFKKIEDSKWIKTGDLGKISAQRQSSPNW